jgi:hypothetical protein
MRIKLNFILLFLTIFLFESASYAQSLEWFGIVKGNAHSTAYIINRIVDHEGNLITAGSFSNTVDFDFTNGTFERTAHGGADYFIAKYSPAGNLIWVHVDSQAGTLGESISNLAIDEDDNIFAAGKESNPNQSFVLKVNSEGQRIWKKSINFIKYYGSDVNYSTFQSILVDLDGVLLQGIYSDSTDFDPGPGKYVLKPNGSSNAFFLKLDDSGSFKWVKSLGGIQGVSTSKTGAEHTHFDSQRNVVVFGSFTDSTDFDLDTSTHILHSTHTLNLYIAKYTSSLQLLWIKQFTGNYGTAFPNPFRGDLAIGPSDSLYLLIPSITGFIYDPGNQNFTVPGVSSSSQRVLKLDTNGIVLRSFQFGKGQEYGEIHVFPNGNMLISAATLSDGDLDPSEHGYLAYSNGSTQAEIPFIAQYDVLGNLLWTRQMGFNSFSVVPLITDDNYNIFIASFSSYDLKIYADTVIDIERDPTDAFSFIIKLSPIQCENDEEDYMIRDQVDDTGEEPNVLNLPSWESPDFMNTLYAHDGSNRPIYYNSSFSNYLSVEVRKIGCNPTTSAKLELYYSIAPSGMEWPEKWNGYTIEMGGDTIIAGAKFAEIDIPPLYKGNVWEYFFDWDCTCKSGFV